MRVVSSWVEVVVVGAWLVRAAVPCRRVEAGRWLEVEVEVGRLWRSAAVLDVVGVALRSMYAAAAKDQSNLYNTVVVEVEAEWHEGGEVEAVGRLDGDNDDAAAVVGHVATAK
mgnify:CR=1 FL=1